MTKENHEMNYTMKYGGIDEVLSGEGKLVDNFEELYPSAENQSLIIIPKVIGVHQTITDDPTTSGEARAYEFAQRVVDQRYNSEEGVDGSLISLVYDSELMDEGVLRTIISKKDIMRRVKLADFRSVPNFNSKPIISDRRVTRLLDDLKSKKTRKIALTLLEREIEYFILNSEHYGLTRIEAINKCSLSEMIQELKESYRREKLGDLGEKNTPNLITDPLGIKLGELLQQIAKRYFKD